MFTDPETVVDIVRWAGVVAGVVGLVAAAPSVPRHVARGVVRGVVGVGHSLGRWLKRIFERWSRASKGGPIVIRPDSILSGVRFGVPSVRHGLIGPVEDQLKQLWDEIGSNADRMRSEDQRLDSRIDEVGKQISSDFEKRISELENSIKSREVASRNVSAWAFGPIMVGIVFTGVPDSFVRLSLPVSLTVSGVGLLASILATWMAWQEMAGGADARPLVAGQR